MCRVWSSRMIKQHKILFWNQSTYSVGFLGFVFVQLDYNLDPHRVQRRRRLCFRCSLILRHSRRATIILMEIGIAGSRCRIPPFSSPIKGKLWICCKCSVQCSEQCRPENKVGLLSVASTGSSFQPQTWQKENLTKRNLKKVTLTWPVLFYWNIK